MARPTKYKPEYCELLIDHMKEGHSFTSFAAIAQCSESTLHEWVKTFPEFLQSKKEAETHGYKALEDIGLELMKKGNAAVWIFTMKNRFNWRDKCEIEEVKFQNKREAITRLRETADQLEREEQAEAKEENGATESLN